MDPVTAIANAVGSLANAIGTPFAINAQNRLQRTQNLETVYSLQAQERMQAQQTEQYLILGAIGLVVVVVILSLKK